MMTEFEIEKETEELTEREQEFLELLKKTRAEFTNYRKRLEQERENDQKLAKADLIVKLLPVLDDFRRAQEALPPEVARAEWAKGIELIKRNMMAVLEEEGVSRIEAEGSDFDPEEHDAFTYEESDKYEEGKVKSVFSDGYRLNGRVIRPARVAVSKGRKRSRHIPVERMRGRRRLMYM